MLNFLKIGRAPARALAVTLIGLPAAGAITSAATGAEVQAAPRAASARAIQGDITFRAAITMEALERSHDTVVRGLRQQVVTLTAQVRSGRGDNARLRQQLTAAKSETVKRLAATDASYAVQQAAFVRSIGGILESRDARIPALLERYAQGDASALDELQACLNSAPDSASQRIVSQHAFATLVLDAFRKKERSDRDAIAAFERVVMLDPDNFDAWVQLAPLYIFAGETQKARQAAEQIERVSREPFTRGHAFVLKANAAWTSGDLRGAQSNYEQAVAVYRNLAAVSYADWKQEHQGATEPAWIIDGGRREWLAQPLSHLAEVQSERGDHAQAVETARESVALRQLNVDEALRHGSKGGGRHMLLGNSASILGDVLKNAGNPSEALAAYRLAIAATRTDEELTRAGAKDAAPLLPPYYLLIPYAEAAIAAGQLEIAQTALMEAKSALQRSKPSAWIVGNEGLYWMTAGELAAARGQRNDAQRAWSSAESSLSQASSVDPNNPKWAKALSRLHARMASTS